MGDGWETRRKRDWSEDWLVVKLGQKGVLDKVTLSTAHFIGNYPKHFSLDGMNAEGKRLRFYDGQDQDWTPILQEQALGRTKSLTDTLQMQVHLPVRLRIFLMVA